MKSLLKFLHIFIEREYWEGFFREVICDASENDDDDGYDGGDGDW